MKNTTNSEAIMGCFLIFVLLIMNGLPLGAACKYFKRVPENSFNKLENGVNNRPNYGVGQGTATGQSVENTFTTAPKLPSNTGVIADHAINSADEVLSMILKQLSKKNPTAREIYYAYKNARRLQELCNFVAYHVNQAYANNDSVPVQQLKDIQYLCTTEGDHDTIV
ncbi:hypothetical protein BVRB_2g031910 [Beta vulgaris subsp. vulgaris]|uniref:Pectinesterase inhibitor domain-containing protein n=1 Tax=Beta vulgaris subsp. vulgaris TaxID=3555 RepID=A0A0J8CX29_BETVV|nr:hypothetical protein BVRB_2g031910 [Beta vulgaris subsp. vulgaris]